MTLRVAAAVPLLLAMLGCAGPRPAPPAAAAIDSPADWRYAGKGAPLVGLDAWLEAFGDPVLPGLVQHALTNNDDVALASARVEEARAQFRSSRAQRLPNVTGVLAGARERSVNPAFGAPEEQTAGQSELSIAWDLDLFGRLRNASDAAKASMLAAKASREGVRLAVVAAVAGGYFTLRGLDARLAVLERTLANRNEERRFARRRVEAGYAPTIDLEQAEAAYRAAEQQIPATQLAIARQEDGLSLLLGVSPRAVPRGIACRDLVVPAAPGLLPSQLLRRRPDIIQSEELVVAADRSLDAARAAFMPSIGLAASGGYVDSSLIGDPVRVFSIGGSFLAPIFDSGRLRAQQDTAAARRDQAAFAYRKTALNAFREVEDALAAVQRYREQESSLTEQTHSLEAVHRLAVNRYRSGYSPYLEQLDAQRALLSAQLAAIQARVDRLGAAVTLYQSLGGGWEPEALTVSSNDEHKRTP